MVKIVYSVMSFICVFLSFLFLFFHLDNDGKLRVEDSHAHVQISLGG